MSRNFERFWFIVDPPKSAGNFWKKCPVVLFEDKFERMDKVSGIGFWHVKHVVVLQDFPGIWYSINLSLFISHPTVFFVAATSTRLSCEVHFAAGRWNAAQLFNQTFAIGCDLNGTTSMIIIGIQLSNEKRAPGFICSGLYYPVILYLGITMNYYKGSY